MLKPAQISTLSSLLGCLCALSGCSDANSSPPYSINGKAECSISAPLAPVFIKGGEFLQGEAKKQFRDEFQQFQNIVGDFKIDAHEVTNAQFSEFVDATGYITVAEVAPSPSDYPEIPPDKLKAGSAVFATTNSEQFMSWWNFVEGANWKHPAGPNSNLQGIEQHPVIHIAYQDALAYAEWKGGDLPTETEWEYAARGGLEGKPFEWGDIGPDEGPARANTWQGQFPVENTVRDGYEGSAPVGCFEPNGYGLFDMTGNVWEWVKDDYNYPNNGIDGLMKGGSFLCAANFCARYRPGARHAQERNFSTNHIGFRVVYRDPPN